MSADDMLLGETDGVPEEKPNRVCVWCGKAWALETHNGIEWAITPATPNDCDHETIDGRS